MTPDTPRPDDLQPPARTPEAWKRPRICPHCGKEIPLLTKMPRDLGLLLNCLLYRVPVEAELNEAWIETTRKHCRMKPERLAELRTGDHARHWPRMLERRAARLAYFKAHGELPPRWMGLLPGEPDHIESRVGLYLYRKGGLAKLKARLRKHPDSATAKLTNRYLATTRIRPGPRKSAAVDDLLARLGAQHRAEAGKLTLKEYEAFKTTMLPDNALPRRFRKRKGAETSLDGDGREAKNARGEGSGDVPRPGSDTAP